MIRTICPIKSSRVSDKFSICGSGAETDNNRGMSGVSEYFIKLVEEEIPWFFPPVTSGRKNEKFNFNVSAWCEAIFGNKERNNWIRLYENPETLKLETAMKMAEIIDIPFFELMTDANRMRRKEERNKRRGRNGNEKPTGTHGE